MNEFIVLNGVYDENGDKIPLYSENGQILGSIHQTLFEDFNNIKEKLVVGEVIYTFNDKLRMSGDFIREVVSKVENLGLHPNLALIIMDAINLYEGGSIPLTEENISNAIEAYYKEVGSGYLRLIEICNNPDLYTYGNISTRFTNGYNKLKEKTEWDSYEQKFNIEDDRSITGGSNETFLNKSFLVENSKEGSQYEPNSNGEFDLELNSDDVEELVLSDELAIDHNIDVEDKISEDELKILLSGDNQNMGDDGDSTFLNYGEMSESESSLTESEVEPSEETIKLELEEEKEELIEDLEALDELQEELKEKELDFNITNQEEEKEEGEEDMGTWKLEELSKSNLHEIADKLVFTDDEEVEEPKEIYVTENQPVAVPDIEELPIDEDEYFLTDDSDILSDFETEVKTLPKIDNTKADVVSNIHKKQDSVEKETVQVKIQPIDPFEDVVDGDRETVYLKEESVEQVKEEKEFELEVEKEEPKEVQVINNEQIELPKEEPKNIELEMMKMFENKLEEVISKTNEKHAKVVSSLNEQIETLTETIKVIKEEKSKPVYVEVPVVKQVVESKPVEEEDDIEVNETIKTITPITVETPIPTAPIPTTPINHDHGRNNKLIRKAHETNSVIYEPKVEEKMHVTVSTVKPSHYIDEEIGYVFKSAVKCNGRKEVKSEGLSKLEIERREIARQVLSSRGEF